MFYNQFKVGLKLLKLLPILLARGQSWFGLPEKKIVQLVMDPVEQELEAKDVTGVGFDLKLKIEPNTARACTCSISCSSSIRTKKHESCLYISYICGKFFYSFTVFRIVAASCIYIWSHQFYTRVLSSLKIKHILNIEQLFMPCLG